MVALNTVDITGLTKFFHKARRYALVPKGLRENIEYRERMIALGYPWVKDHPVLGKDWCPEYSIDDMLEWRECVRQACAEDPLFWINTFVWTYDPRKKWPDPSSRPFITYEYQDPVILEIIDAIADHDLVGEKSRTMGYSWMCLVSMMWHWQFHEGQSFLLLSSKEDKVDKTDDMDALLPKLEFAWKLQPTWLRPAISRSHLHFFNLDMGSSIDGEANVKDAGRGGRRTAIMPDEFSMVEEGHAVLEATRDVSPCRLFTSTPAGTANAFYTMVEKAVRGEVKMLTLHWALHPDMAEGLYYEPGETLANPRLNYPEGKPRSPWYDGECKRAGGPREIAAQLDIDYGASTDTFFDLGELEKIRLRDRRPAVLVGELEYDPVTGAPIRFTKHPAGRFRLWQHLDAGGVPLPANPDPRANSNGYGVGADVAMGSRDPTGRGASRSALCIINRDTGEQVGEFVDATIAPKEFGVLAVAACRFFHGAELIWETNGGTGATFRDTVLHELAYSPLYRPKPVGRRGGSKSPEVGWKSSKPGKVALFHNLRNRFGHTAIIRSDTAMLEFRNFLLIEGSVVHAKAKYATDECEKGESHGDVGMAVAMAVLLLRLAMADMGRKPDPRYTENPMTVQGRRNRRLNEEREQRDARPLGHYT